MPCRAPVIITVVKYGHGSVFNRVLFHPLTSFACNNNFLSPCNEARVESGKPDPAQWICFHSFISPGEKSVRPNRQDLEFTSLLLSWRHQIVNNRVLICHRAAGPPASDQQFDVNGHSKSKQHTSVINFVFEGG